MATILTIFLVLSVATPFLTRVLSTRVFYVIALVPAGTFVWTLLQGNTIREHGAITEFIPWVPQLDLALSFRMDTLAWLLALVVSGVGALVLIYCARYFSPREPGLGRFAALLFAFAGTMFGLVTADDAILMFMFWEITSVLSYLLIGHYTGKKESRGAALQALLVTTFGGLVMLVGVIMISVQAGTTSLSGIVAAALTGPATTVAILLILVGALSKSAIVPFHFWLPAAMAAPTPVSAYLHAAAMVKAGIYLVARLAPGYSDTPGWKTVLIGLGVWTMLVGAWRSLRQYDLKLVLAYGTVSQLGFLMVVVGFGTPDAALAGIALLLAHAVYKATLFLSVGIIDHTAGTRDWRQLSGLGRRMPGLAVIAGIAIASMAGLPPLFGFVAKEAVFGAFFDAALHGDVFGWIALIGTALGSAMTVAYSVRFFWGAFATRRGQKATKLHHRDRGILVAPAILSLASIGLGIFATALNPWVEAYPRSFPGEGHAHLALWHGFEPALGLSAVVILIGCLIFWQRARVARLQEALPPLVDSSRGYWTVTRVVDRVSAKVTIFGQRGGLPQYLSTILVVFVLTLGTLAVIGRSWPEEVRLFDYPQQVVIAVVMALATLGAAWTRKRMAAVLLVGVTGFGMVALFAFHGAPDLALTQALVETITIIAFVLVLRRLPGKSQKLVNRVHRVRRAIIAIGTGAVMGAIALIALGARGEPTIALKLPQLAFEEGHGRNVVNVALVDIRAWDTMGEISVLVVFATGIASLLFVSGRADLLPRVARRVVGARARRMAPLPDPDVPNTHLEERQSWLVGGGSIASANRSILLEVLVRLMFHPAIVVSIFLLFVGHNSPGGGFAGGLLAGLALVFRYLAGGRHELREAIPIDAGKLLGLGLFLAVGTAIGSLFFGAEILTTAYLSTDIPVLGHISIGTSTIFDIGVYLVVVGLVLDILRSLGAEVDRQQDLANIADESTDEFSPGQQQPNDDAWISSRRGEKK
ncbi:Na+/H+ antiporter subunit A [Mycetocola spongiae]|uniref:Na+/H+ antiporter subunit A n=1 Tax=Mycetocola spongiae TaxID=2859226 RepID=UPI001CF33EBB|nr:Na+/H+ antiporter subunit A [Mycetocola spongiae]UCR88720.1 Na+/H+ antiporter subunit A [Mycetocola spongiae]